MIFFFSSRRRHTRFDCDWSSDVCSSDLGADLVLDDELLAQLFRQILSDDARHGVVWPTGGEPPDPAHRPRRIALRSEEHTSELQSPANLLCRLLLEKKKNSPAASTA